VFERLGAENVRIVDTVTREDASSSTGLKQFKSTGVFFTGETKLGSQAYLRTPKSMRSFTNATLKE